MKALLLTIVVLSVSFLTIGCQRETKASEPKIIRDTVYVINDSLAIQQAYLDYCISKDCFRTDTCCEAIDLLADGLHDTDCPIYKSWYKKISKKVKVK